MPNIRSMGLDTKARASLHVRTRAFDGEIVVLDLLAGEYYALDEIGSRLWNGLQSGLTVREVAEQICSDYDAPSQRILADLLELAQNLEDKGLISAEVESP